MKALPTISVLVLSGLYATVAQAAAIQDRATAIKVGCAVIRANLPKTNERCDRLSADLKDGVWTVYTVLPKGMFGGGPNLQLSEKDGRVLKFWLTQ